MIMQKRSILVMFSIFLVLASMSFVSAQENITSDEIITSPDINDVEIISDGDAGSFDELSALINSGNSTITLDKDYKYSSDDSVSSSGIIISNPITVNGNGHTIDGSNSVRIFYVNSSNVVLNNISFINAYTSSSASVIAVNSGFSGLAVNNCNFSNNTAVSHGGVIYSNSPKTIIDNCNFIKNHADGSAGAVYIRGDDSVINNSYFDDNDAERFGGAVYWSGSNGIVNNSYFKNSDAWYSGGAIYWYGSKGSVYNTKFEKNEAGNGGAIFSNGVYTSLKNCTFLDNYVDFYAGAVYFYNSYGSVEDCTFESNEAGATGGAVYSDDYRTIIKNSTFKLNHATYAGAVALFSSDAQIKDSTFENNSATSIAGAAYIRGYRSGIDNSTFINNYGSSGGGAYVCTDPSNNYINSNNYVRNSKFINNSARYGGGALSATSYATIDNSQFINNSAGNYGGAIDLTNCYLKNSLLENNSAIYGGSLYIYNSQIDASTFINNNAYLGNSIYILTQSSINNSQVSDSDIFTQYNDTRGDVVSSEHNIARLMFTDAGYFAYCSEKFTLSPYSGVYDVSMDKLRNALNHQSVGEYLKILIYLYVNTVSDLSTTDFHNYVWTFTDYEYWNSSEPMVKEVIRLYDSGFRVPTENACKVLPNGTLMYFNFSSLITPSGQQNLFLFKFDYGDEINETLSKESLNKTAFIGDTVEYRIVVNNLGNSPIYDLWVEDKDYSKGLIYESWISEKGNWTYNNQTQQWVLDVLNPKDHASIILTFRVMINGTLYNNATTGVGNVNVTNSTNTTVVYNPNFTVEKISRNKTLVLGEKAEFEIIVRNTGDIDLTNVTVLEKSYDGLIYDSYIDNGQWIYSNNIWRINKLAVGESAKFIVVFNTTASGNFTNVVVAGSNETSNRTANNTTKVLKPDLNVSKISLTPKIIVGNEAVFEIVVTNTGETDLGNVFVVESKYGDGLVYLGYSSVNGNWIHDINNEGRHMFTLNDLLKVGKSACFRVIFMTTKLGNVTNTVSAGYNNTTSANSTNVTEVVKKPSPENRTNNTVSENRTDVKVPENRTNNTVSENRTSKENKTLISQPLDKNATGNPLILLLMVLAIIPMRRFRK